MAQGKKKHLYDFVQAHGIRNVPCIFQDKRIDSKMSGSFHKNRVDTKLSGVFHRKTESILICPASFRRETVLTRQVIGIAFHAKYSRLTLHLETSVESRCPPHKSRYVLTAWGGNILSSFIQTSFFPPLPTLL